MRQLCIGGKERGAKHNKYLLDRQEAQGIQDELIMPRGENRQSGRSQSSLFAWPQKSNQLQSYLDFHSFLWSLQLQTIKCDLFYFVKSDLTRNMSRSQSLQGSTSGGKGTQQHPSAKIWSVTHSTRQDQMSKWQDIILLKESDKRTMKYVNHASFFKHHISEV